MLHYNQYNQDAHSGDSGKDRRRKDYHEWKQNTVALANQAVRAVDLLREEPVLEWRDQTAKDWYKLNRRSSRENIIRYAENWL
jgi:hypothetical protein